MRILVIEKKCVSGICISKNSVSEGDPVYQTNQPTNQICKYHTGYCRKRSNQFASFVIIALFRNEQVSKKKIIQFPLGKSCVKRGALQIKAAFLPSVA